MNLNSLQPMTIVQVIDHTFRIYRDHFVAFVGMVAVVIVPLTLFNLLLTNNSTTAFTQTNDGTFGFEVPQEVWLSLMVSLVMFIIQNIVINGLITYISSEYHLGQKVSIGEAFSGAGNRLGSLTLGLFLLGIVLLVMLFLIGFLTAVCGLFAIIFPIIFYLAMTAYFYIVPVFILERTGVTFGISRAIALGKARFWHTIGLVLLIYIMTFIISAVFGFVAGIAGGGVSDAADLTTTGTNTVAVVINLIVTIFITPILPIALTIMYYDTRVRVEGLDIALSAVEGDAPRPADVESPEPESRLITGKDVANIILLIIGLAALVFVLGLLGSSLINL